jgi:hypothetical protein
MSVVASPHLARLLRRARFCLAILLMTCASSQSHAGMAVIGHAVLQEMDRTVVGRIYTGRTVQIAGISVQPVNMKAGDAKRAAFLSAVLQQSDDDYIAYWIVRRAIGKGTSPPEVESAQAVINFVRSTKGAIGYVDETDLVPGLNVLLILP